MNNLTPISNIDPNELPEGFTTAGGSGEKDAKQQQQEEQKQAILEQALTSEALERLRRIKLVKAEKVAKLENAIVSMAMSGTLPGPINEGKLIEMLERGSKSAAQARAGGEQKISIQRKKYAFDSDDDDDNDDDLM